MGPSSQNMAEHWKILETTTKKSKIRSQTQYKTHLQFNNWHKLTTSTPKKKTTENSSVANWHPFTQGSTWKTDDFPVKDSGAGRLLPKRWRWSIHTNIPSHDNWHICLYIYHKINQMQVKMPYMEVTKYMDGMGYRKSWGWNSQKTMA